MMIEAKKIRLNLLPSNNLDQAGDLHCLVPLDLLSQRSLNTQGKIVTGLGRTRLYCFQPGVWANVERHLGAHDRGDQLLHNLSDVWLLAKFSNVLQYDSSSF